MGIMSAHPAVKSREGGDTHGWTPDGYPPVLRGARMTRFSVVGAGAVDSDYGGESGGEDWGRTFIEFRNTQ